MQIRTLVLGPFDANCYLVEDGNDCLIIDPGYPDDRTKQWVLEHKGALRYILLTHCHCDHICGVEPLRALTDAPVCIGAADADGYTDDRLNLAEQMGGMYPSMAQAVPPDTLLHDGDRLPFGNGTISCLHTPGHSVGGFCFLIGDALFSGDTLFRDSVGRTDFYGGSFSELNHSLKKIVEICGDMNYSIYSGHGEATTLLREKLQNPYLVNL